MAFLGEYTCLSKLGSGGYAEVFKVRHNQLEYVRAVRVLNQTIVSEQDDLYKQFMHECKLLLQLGNGNHPNIVHIYKPDYKEQKAFVEMDFIDGQNLSDYVDGNGGFVEIDEVLQFTKDISSALSYCHHDIFEYRMDADKDKLKTDPNDGSRFLIDKSKEFELINKYKIIHNDMHSGNIMRKKHGGYILLDFGLSIEGGAVTVSSRRANGAIEFKAPEKWDKDSITEQSDIYGFGCILYMMLTGRPPFLADDPTSFTTQKYIYEAHKSIAPPSILTLRKASFENKYNEPYKKDYPDWLEDMAMKCLAKNPSDRYLNGKHLYDTFIKNYIEYGKTMTKSSVSTDAQYYEMQLTINKLTVALRQSQQEARCLLEALRKMKK